MATAVKKEMVSPARSTVVKPEPISPDYSNSVASTEGNTDSEAKIIALAQTCPKGISDKEIQNVLPGLQPAERAQVINDLLRQGLLALFNQGDKLIYKLKDPSSTSKMKGADNEEKIVYDIIESRGNKGIWMRDIRIESNLGPTELNKILKNLENRKLIKAVKSVSASKKKVYMLYNLEPDSSITGGAWYNDQDFEAEFVDVLNQQCYRYLQQKLEAVKSCNEGPIATQNMASASSEDVLKFISELGISKVQLSVPDMETILNTLVYDGKVERRSNPQGSVMYRAIESLMPQPAIVRTPCGVCPVFNHCSDIGAVNAKKCVYMTEWLD